MTTAPLTAAERAIVEAHTDLVWKIASRIETEVRGALEAAELVAAGTFGLVEAVRRFRPDLGVPFRGYAAVRIRGAIRDDLRRRDVVTRRTRQLASAVEARSDLPDTAAVTAVAAELGSTPERVRAAQATVARSRTASIDAPVPGTDVTIDLRDDAAVDPADLVDASVLHAELAAAVHRLDWRDRYVVEEVYLQNRKLADVGVDLGVTESRVCQIARDVTRRLRGELLDRFDDAAR